MNIFLLIIAFILSVACSIGTGYNLCRISMLRQMGRELDDLEIDDPQFKGKIYILNRLINKTYGHNND